LRGVAAILANAGAGNAGSGLAAQEDRQSAKLLDGDKPPAGLRSGQVLLRFRDGNALRLRPRRYLLLSQGSQRPSGQDGVANDTNLRILQRHNRCWLSSRPGFAARPFNVAFSGKRK